jgi:hypothetical protein
LAETIVGGVTVVGDVVSKMTWMEGGDVYLLLNCYSGKTRRVIQKSSGKGVLGGPIARASVGSYALALICDQRVIG